MHGMDCYMARAIRLLCMGQHVPTAAGAHSFPRLGGAHRHAHCIAVLVFSGIFVSFVIVVSCHFFFPLFLSAGVEHDGMEWHASGHGKPHSNAVSILYA